jgi:ribosomal protein L10
MLDDGSIVKLCRRHARGEQEGRFLLNEISQVILSYKVLPLFVAEGSSTAKLKKIRSNIYLLNAYEKLSLLKNSVIFIYGHSASISDEHIYNAIKDKNNLLYFSIYDESQLEDIKENLTSFGIKPEEVVFVDSKSVNLKNN